MLHVTHKAQCAFFITLSQYSFHYFFFSLQVSKSNGEREFWIVTKIIDSSVRCHQQLDEIGQDRTCSLQQLQSHCE